MNRTAPLLPVGARLPGPGLFPDRTRGPGVFRGVMGCAHHKRIFWKGRKCSLLLNNCLWIFRAHHRGLSSLAKAKLTQVTVTIPETARLSCGLVGPGEAETCALWARVRRRHARCGPGWAVDTSHGDWRAVSRRPPL